MQVAFVTCTDPRVIDEDVDRPLLIKEFESAGIKLRYVPWEDNEAAWDSFDLVVVRSTWNYTTHLVEFREWLAGQRLNQNFHNPAQLLEWNLDKRYLGDLEALGVRVIKTHFADDLLEFDQVVSELNVDEIVVKPATSAGSRNTGRFGRASMSARRLASLIFDEGGTVMVQPYVESVGRHGEVGTVLFNGEISHSFCKGPLLDAEGKLLGGDYREEITSTIATDALRELVVEANDAVERIARGRGWLRSDEHLLYDRYDVVELADGTPAILEAELFEPSFFLSVDSEAPRRFLETCRRRATSADPDSSLGTAEGSPVALK